MIRRRWLAVGLVAAMVAGGQVVPGRAAQGQSTEVSAPEPSKATTGGTVTLMTGDRVTYTPVPGRAPLVKIQPAAGRKGISFRSLGVGIQLEVILRR